MKAPTGEHKHVPTVKDMSLRDWFAGQALVGIVMSNSSPTYEQDGRAAYQYADAMLKVRGQ